MSLPSPVSARPSAHPAPHWVLPFAASLSEPCQHALPRLNEAGAWPHLHRLLSSLQVSQRLLGDEYALSMPHERVLGAEMGWLTPAEHRRQG